MRKDFLKSADPGYLVISAEVLMRMTLIGMAIAVD